MLTTYICLNTHILLEEPRLPLWAPEWDYDTNPCKWEQNHFLLCVKAGLQAGHQTAINYSEEFAVTQGPDENPIIFLETLREAFIKHTDLDSES